MNYRKKAMLMAGALLCLNLSIYSQSISLKMSNVSVKKAMTELQTKSGYSFVYIQVMWIQTVRFRLMPAS